MDDWGANPSAIPSLRQDILQSITDAGISLDRLSRDAYLNVGKRAFDVIVAGTALLVFSPIFLLIALLIKLDSKGPVLFHQQRTGYLGKRFGMTKFRTMVINAEELKAELMHLNEHDSDSPDFKIKKDPRITKIGHVLRKTSLDELPNLISVLKGDMSIVGPRPTSFGPETYKRHHYPRLAITPGITGLWQVCGRSDVDFDQRTRLDRMYIQKASFFYDMKIILQTVLQVFRSKGAY